MCRVSLCLVVAAVLPLWWAGCALGEAPQYERDVKPVLKARCFACHGGLKQEAGLRLDSAGLVRQGGDSGAAVEPGRPEASLLLQRVTAEDREARMPPDGESLTEDQVEALRSWIRAGAPATDGEEPEADPRTHWAFQPPRRPDLPAAAGGESRNAIDAFLDAARTRAGVTPRPETDRPVLLRRVHIDLIGLPPTREELHAFLADQSPDAYENVVERLLGDPRHGERWARHWMDVWRYSDWYGRRDVNDVRNSASQIFRWRDWIVRSLNDGKGYDRMIQEMLSADEICPEDYDAGVATGFLIRNYYSLNPNDWMRNAVEHTGKAFLGLTFNCAHCHDHKYDPVTQTDYFQMRAFFEPIFVRQDRMPGEADPGVFQDYTYAGSRQVQRLGSVRTFDRHLDAPTRFYTGGDERNRVKERGSIPPDVPAFLKTASFQIEPVTLPSRAWYPGLRPEIQATMRADAKRTITAAEKALAALSSTAQSQADSRAGEAVASGSAAGEAAANETKLTEKRRQAAEAKLAAARAELSSLEARIAVEQAKYIELAEVEDIVGLVRAASLREREANVRRAEADVLAKDVALLEVESKAADDKNRAAAVKAATKALASARTALDKAQAALADDKLADSYSPLSQQFPKQSTGRRRALAQWITSRENPLAARVAVNHIWTRHFHAPLVASMYNFGRNGDRPTHPELLDWLAVEFMESGWNMKHVHRLIVTSAAYRRDSKQSVASASAENNDPTNKDPENKLLWRMNAARMESEVLRDSLLYVAGQLDLTMGGVEIENKDALTTNRRTLYYSSHPEAGGKSALGELFDAPNPLDCYRRVSSIIPQQALALTNGEMVQQSSVALVENWSAGLPSAAAADETANREFVVAMFEMILSRPPSDRERQVSLEIVDRQRELAAEPNSADALRQARQSLARILLNHNDFVTVR